MKRFSKIGFLLACVVGFGSIGLAQSSTITTYAGHERGLPSSGTPALTQYIGRPVSVVLDSFGGFYFASADQNRIYRIDANGTLTVIAGTGMAGFNGDDGPAISAQLTSPWDIALDAAGNLFIADSGNHRIREVTPDGVIRTVAGIGTAGFSGDGGSALSAQLDTPSGITVDAAGNLFISDSANHRVRQVTLEGVIQSVAGDGTQGFSGDGGPAAAGRVNFPRGVAVDGAGNLFIADFGNNRIRKVSASGVMTTVAGSGTTSCCGYDGPALSTSLGGPSDVQLDAAGNLFIAELCSWFIRKLTPAGVIRWVAGDTNGNLIDPAGVAVDGDGNVFVADSGNNRIRRVNRDGVLTTVAGIERGGFSGDGSAASSAELRGPYDLAMDPSGNLFIADQGNNRIRKVDPSGIITTVAGSGSIGSEGGFSGDGGPATSALLRYPAGIAVDAQGNLFIADTGNHRIRKVDPAGIITTVAGVGTNGFSDGGAATSAQLSYPQDVAVDGAGNLFIADSANGVIRKVNGAQTITRVAAGLRYPTSVAVDADGNLFIAEFYLNSILKLNPMGVITRAAGTGAEGFGGDGGPASEARLAGPWGVSVDGAGNLLIADSFNNRIRKMTRDGVITTVAGVGIPGFSGDFGPAASAQLDAPTGVVSGLDGNLFIADASNHRIRKVSTLMGPVLLLGSTQYRVGDAWSLKVDFAALNTSVHLLGTSNGQTWEIPVWVTTDGSGSFKVEGTFAGGTEGSHTLQVEIGGVLSNTIAFRVSNQ